MTISVRVASTADIGAIVRLNRDVQQLHAELEPSFSNQTSTTTRLLPSLLRSLPCRRTIFDWPMATMVRTATCGLRCRIIQRHH